MAIGKLLDKLPSALGVKPATMAYAGSAMSVVGAAASVIGFFMGREENRRIIGELRQIKAYLRKLDERVADIEKQNKEILAALDQLPDQIQSIVDERVGLALLNERYNSLESIRINYLNLNEVERKRYRINTIGWDRLSEALTYLVRHENRISKLFDVLSWCEFAIVASEGRGAPVVRSLIDTKGHMVIPLFEELRDQLQSAHNELIGLLSGQYVAEHNFGNDTSNLDGIEYVLVSRKREYTTEWFIAPAPGVKIVNGGTIEERTVSLPKNIVFNENLELFDQRFASIKDKLAKKLQEYLAVRDLLVMFVSYSEIVDEDRAWLDDNPLSTEVEPGISVPDEPAFIAMA